MKISSILDSIDNGSIALPEFQRGYVWNRGQVRGLFQSLYRGHPVGSLLTWATNSSNAEHRGGGNLAPGTVKLLLDGQQRITSLYGVIRGRPPRFFDGDDKVFTGLYFNLENEEFEFYQPIKMRDDISWIDVTRLMQKGNAGLGEFIAEFNKDSDYVSKIGDYTGRMSQLLSIKDKNFLTEEVTGADKKIEVVVDIFNRVNSGGTKLSKGDLALAKICADWPQARNKMNYYIGEWRDKQEYSFTLDWLLRSVNTVLTGEAQFLHLHDKNADDIINALDHAVRHINTALNMIGGRLGLDHDRVLFSRYAVPVMVYFLHNYGGIPDGHRRDKLLYWYVQSGMWGRFSASTESVIDKDLGILEQNEGNLNKLIADLRLSHGGLHVEPDHFDSHSVRSRFYPVLYMLTRMTEAKDWDTGLPLKSNLLGKMNKLEVHHIFPKSRLKKFGYSRQEINALANFCFLTKGTNLRISDKIPEDYFLEIAEKHPNALQSQWIPEDTALWKVENFREFLIARRELLAMATNTCLDSLLHGDASLLEASKSARPTDKVMECVISEEEERELEQLNDWVVEQGYTRGEMFLDCVDSQTGEQRAILDLAWPNGVQSDLTQPVAVLLNADRELISLANSEEFLCFTAIEDFKSYVDKVSSSKQ